MSEQGSLEKRLEKSLEAEQRMQEEMDSLKAERDSRMAEYQRLLDKERENYKLKLRDLDGKGSSAQVKQTEQMLQFEKERAKWEQEKSYIQNQKDDAVETQQRLEKKVETLLRENEKLKNDVRANRKQMFSGGAGAGVGGGLGLGHGSGGLGGPSTNFHAAMVGKAVYDKYGGSSVNKSTVLGAGGFGVATGGLLGNKDGSGTDRSTYHHMQHFNPLNPKEDKSFTSPGGNTTGNTSMTHGAVSALNLTAAGLTGGAGFESSFAKHLLSTPSSKSKSIMSQDEDLDLTK